jgi:hypothetical protein
MGPIIFLNMVDEKNGQYDAKFYPSDSTKFFNFSQIEANVTN